MMFKQWKLRLALYFGGVRFYKTESLPKSIGFIDRAEFIGTGEGKITLSFYKEACVDLVYRRGRIKEEKYIGYTVHAQFIDMPESKNALKYNNLKFFFRWNKWLAADDRTICNKLTVIFIERITSEALRDASEPLREAA